MPSDKNYTGGSDKPFKVLSPEEKSRVLREFGRTLREQSAKRAGVSSAQLSARENREKVLGRLRK